MLNALLKKSLVWLFAIVFSLTIATSVAANVPQSPSMYWLNFDSPTLQSVQIAQCQDKDCQKSILLKQYGICTGAGCLKAAPKLAQSQPLQLDCANNLCLVALSPTYDKKELDPTRVYAIAQIDKRVFRSKVFSLAGRQAGSSTFTVRVVANKLDIIPNPSQIAANSPVFQNLFFIFLVLTLVIESAIWAGYLRWKQADLVAIQAILLSVFIVHSFSFGIVWFSFPGLQHFASRSIRYGGLAWLGCSILYGTILSLYLQLAKNPSWRVVSIGSVAHWLGAAFISLIIGGLGGYVSPLPVAAGLSTPMAILASEIFVVGYEAWIIQRLKRDTLDFKTALLVSFLANVASCLVGLALASFVPK